MCSSIDTADWTQKTSWFSTGHYIQSVSIHVQIHVVITLTFRCFAISSYGNCSSTCSIIQSGKFSKFSSDWYDSIFVGFVSFLYSVFTVCFFPSFLLFVTTQNNKKTLTREFVLNLCLLYAEHLRVYFQSRKWTYVLLWFCMYCSSDMCAKQRKKQQLEEKYLLCIGWLLWVVCLTLPTQR